MDNGVVEIGRVAFNAYVKAKQGTTYDSKPIHSWEELPNVDPIAQDAWTCAAKAVISAARDDNEGAAAAWELTYKKVLAEAGVECETVGEGIGILIKLAA